MTVEELSQVSNAKPYREHLEDYPFAVPEWERQKEIRRAAAQEAAAAAAAEAAREGRVLEDPVPVDAVEPSPLPVGCMHFSPEVAFIYILEK